MNRPTKALIMGLRGAGKTTASRSAAELAGRRFVDLDRVVMLALGAQSVTEIFQTQGEPAFREGETAALRETLAESGSLVVALGGGTPTAPGAADLIRAAQATGDAVAIYMRAPADDLAARLRGAGVGDRPRLIDGDIDEEMRAVFDARDPLYRSLADHEIDATGRAETVAREIAAILNSTQ